MIRWLRNLFVCLVAQYVGLQAVVHRLWCNLQYCLSDKPEILNFEPAKTGLRKYPITQFQPVYYAAESFEEAKEKLR